MCCGGHAASGGLHSGWVGMLQVAGVVLDGLADVSVKDKLFLLRAADFCPLGWSGLFPSELLRF